MGLHKIYFCQSHQLKAESLVHVYHRLRRMDTILGGPQDAYSGKTVTIVGDASPMGIIFCGVPATAFHRTLVIDRVATAATIGVLVQQHRSGQVDLATHGNLNLVQPDAPACSHFWMLIPLCFISEILCASTKPEGLNPRDLWVNVVTPCCRRETRPRRSLSHSLSGVAWPTLVESAAPTHWLQLPHLHFILAGAWNCTAAAAWPKISRTINDCACSSAP
jgi:hypothetical protein